MTRAALLVALLVLGLAPAAQARQAPGISALIEKLDVAIRLEREAMQDIPLFADSAAEKLRRSHAILDGLRSSRALPKTGRLGHLRAIAKAQKLDADAAHDLQSTSVSTASEIAIVDGDIREALGLKESLRHALERTLFVAAGTKAAPKTKVDPPACRFAAAARRAAGCFTADVWDINVPANAVQARCEFRAGRTLLNSGRPLFKGVLQETTCELRGVRGGHRVVRAVLRLTALDQRATGTGTRDVSVTAFWR